MLPKPIIDSVISFQSSETAQKEVSRYLLLARIIQILAALCLPVLAAALYYNNYLIYKIAFCVLLLLLVFYYGIFKKKLRARAFRPLQQQCKPLDFCDFYYALLCRARSEKTTSDHIWNFCRGLFYAGRHEDAFSIMQAAAKSARSPANMLHLHCFFCDYFFEKRDGEQLALHVQALQELSSRARGALNATQIARLRARMQLLTQLQLMQQGHWQELYDLLLSAKSLKDTLLFQVDRQRLLAIAATALGDTERARGHLTFVAAHGGQLWYVPECRAQLDALPQ